MKPCTVLSDDKTKSIFLFASRPFAIGIAGVDLDQPCRNYFASSIKYLVFFRCPHGKFHFIARAMHQEGRLRLAVGKNEEAGSLFRQAMAISRESGIGYCVPLILASLARACR